MKSQLAAVMERTEEPELVKHGSEEISNQSSQIYDLIAHRAFDIFESRGGSPGHELEDWFRAESELLHPVRLNVTESNDEYIVRAEVPGFGSKEIRVIVEPLHVAISGKRETREDEENGKTICSESRAGRIFRILDLPSVVDTSKVSTTLKDGVLIVDLPKAQNVEKVHAEPIAA
ncbi:MAG: Hsp20 family protein [Candidatus Sulfotelmatobacter sp.]